MSTRGPEAQVQHSTLQVLRALGFVVFRRNVGAVRVRATATTARRFIRFAEPGQSDIYGWIPRTGRHVEIEVKARGKKPTPEQLAWLLECHRSGCVAFWGDNARTIELVARAVLKGARIEWLDGGPEFDQTY